MVEVLYMITSNAIERAPGNPNDAPALNLVGPTAMLRPTFIPSMFSFGLTLALRGINVHVSHEFTLKLRAPDATVVFDTGPQRTPAENPSDAPLHVEDQSLMMSTMLMNIPLRLNGKYDIVLNIDGQELVCPPVYVRSVENPYG